ALSVPALSSPESVGGIEKQPCGASLRSGGGSAPNAGLARILPVPPRRAVSARAQLEPASRCPRGFRPGRPRFVIDAAEAPRVAGAGARAVAHCGFTRRTVDTGPGVSRAVRALEPGWAGGYSSSCRPLVALLEAVGR